MGIMREERGKLTVMSKRRRASRKLRVGRSLFSSSGTFSWLRSVDGIALFLFAAGTCFLTGYGQQRALGVILVLATCITALADRRLRNAVWPVPPELKCYSVWVLWAVGTGILVGSDIGMVWTGGRVLIQMAVMVWAAYLIMSRIRNVDAVYWALIVGGLLQVAATLFGFNAGTDVVSTRTVEREEGADE